MSAPGFWLVGTLVVSVLFGTGAPVLSRRIAPERAVWLLSVGSLLVAGGAVVAPALVVVTVAGQWPVLAGMGDWSARFLASSISADGMVAISATVVLAAQAWRLGRAAYTTGRQLVSAWLTCRDASTELVVVADAHPVVFALPGWPGRVVASRGLLQRLDPAQRRAVLAHEQRHLRGHHDLHLFAAALAAAADPLLLRIPPALRLATERSADEASAAETGDRRLVAAAIGFVADLCSPGTQPVAAMEAAGADVSLRVRSLLGAPPRRRPGLQAVLAALAVASVAVAALAAFDTKHLFELAERAHMVALHR